MIEINLVPATLRKKENSGAGFWAAVNLPKEILLGVGGLFVVLLVLIHSVFIGAYILKFTHQLVYKTTWARMSPDKNNIDSISKELKDLKAKMVTIDDITSKKTFLWSQKLNMISNLLPKGVWLRKMTWNNTSLVIEGSAYSKLHDEMIIVGNYVSNLKKEDGFVKDFISVELSSVNRVKKSIVEVADFIITAKIK